MSTNATAAAIGIKITADPKEAQKAIAELNRQIGGFGGEKRGRWSAELDELRGLAGKGVDGLEKLTWGFGRAAAGATKFGLGLGVVGATAAAVGFADMGVRFATAGAIAGRTADRLGMPIERLSQMQIAAKLAGASAEDMTSSLQGLQETANAAANGQNNDAFAEFKAAGINIGSAANAAKNYATWLPKIADEVQRLSKTNPHAALKMLDYFGISRDLYPMLQNGSAGLATWMDKAKQFGPLTEKNREDARALETIMAELGEKFAQFGRIGGQAVAPGITKFLAELEQYLAAHTDDVTAFFHDVEQGIEWLTTPKNLKWLHDALQTAGEDLKHLYHLVQEVEQSPLVRRLLGLPVDAAATAGGPAIGQGIAAEDDGGRLERALQAAPTNGPGMFRQIWNWATGAGSHPAAKLSPELERLSDSEAKGQGVPTGFARTIFGIEHGLNADGTPAVSPAGAIGAGQLMPGTAAELGVKDPRDLAQNVHGSVTYMKQLLAKFGGNELVAAAAYNAGPNSEAVAYFARTGDPSHLPTETQGYIRMVQERLGSAGGEAPVDASPTYNSYAQADRRDRLVVELRHVNPPPGAQLRTVEADPSQVQVLGPKVMGAMPGAGTPRNVGRDGW